MQLESFPGCVQLVKHVRLLYMLGTHVWSAQLGSCALGFEPGKQVQAWQTICRESLKVAGFFLGGSVVRLEMNCREKVRGKPQPQGATAESRATTR